MKNKKMNNLHWTITASDEKHKLATGGYTLHQIVDISVKHLGTEEEALKRAKQIVKRKHMFLRAVSECNCAKEALNHRKQLEATKEYTKIFKKHLGGEDEDGK